MKNKTIANTETNLRLTTQRLINTWTYGHRHDVMQILSNSTPASALYLTGQLVQQLRGTDRDIFCNLLLTRAVTELGPTELERE